MRKCALFIIIALLTGLVVACTPEQDPFGPGKRGQDCNGQLARLSPTPLPGCEPSAAVNLAEDEQQEASTVPTNAPEPTAVPPTPTQEPQQSDDLKAFLDTLKKAGFDSEKFSVGGIHPNAESPPRFSPDHTQAAFYAVNLTMRLPSYKSGEPNLVVALKEDPQSSGWITKIADSDPDVPDSNPRELGADGQQHKTYRDKFYPGSWDFVYWRTAVPPFDPPYEGEYHVTGYNGWVLVALVSNIQFDLPCQTCSTPTP